MHDSTTDVVCAGYQSKVNEAFARSGSEQAKVVASYAQRAGCSVNIPTAIAATNGLRSNPPSTSAKPESDKSGACAQRSDLVDSKLRAGDRAGAESVATGMSECGTDVQARIAKYDTDKRVRKESDRSAACTQMSDLIDAKLRAGDRSGAGSIAMGMRQCATNVEERIAKYDADKKVSDEQARLARFTAPPTEKDFEFLISSVTPLPQCVRVLSDGSKRVPTQDRACSTALNALCSAPVDSNGNSDGYLERLVLSFTGEAASEQSFPLTWLAAQRCVARRISPNHGDAQALHRLRDLAGKGALEFLADCLDGCELSAAARREVETLEGGRGYLSRYDRSIAQLETSVANAKDVGEIRKLVELRAQIGSELLVHKDRLKEKTDPLQARLQKLEARATSALPGLAQGEVDSALVHAREQLRILADAAASKKPIDQEIVDKAADAAREQFTTASSLVADFRAISGFDSERNQKAVDAGKIEQRTLDTKIVGRLDRQQAIAHLRSDVCNADRTLAQLHEKERNAKRVDERSGTMNLSERRGIAAGIIFFEDKRADALHQLSKVGAGYDQNRDCSAK